MRHLVFILFFYTCISFVASAQLPPQEYGRNIAAALKAKSFEKFKALFVDTTDLKEVLSEKKWPQDTSSYRANYEKLLSTAENDCKRIFNDIIEKGEQLGIDWSAIEYHRMEADIIKPGYSNHRVLKGYLNFGCKGVGYRLTGLEAVQVSRGFKLTRISAVSKIAG